jgi:hypothetical protein
MNVPKLQKKIIFTVYPEHLAGILFAKQIFDQGLVFTDNDMSWLDDLVWELAVANNPWTEYE